MDFVSVSALVVRLAPPSISHLVPQLRQGSVLRLRFSEPCRPIIEQRYCRTESDDVELKQCVSVWNICNG